MILYQELVSSFTEKTGAKIKSPETKQNKTKQNCSKTKEKKTTQAFQLVALFKCRLCFQVTWPFCPAPAVVSCFGCSSPFPKDLCFCTSSVCFIPRRRIYVKFVGSRAKPSRVLEGSIFKRGKKIKKILSV